MNFFIFDISIIFAGLHFVKDINVLEISAFGLVNLSNSISDIMESVSEISYLKNYITLIT